MTLFYGSQGIVKYSGRKKIIKNLYIENSVRNLKFVERIIKNLNPQSIITCEKYQEVFNIKSQNFGYGFRRKFWKR